MQEVHVEREGVSCKTNKDEVVLPCTALTCPGLSRYEWLPVRGPSGKIGKTRTKERQGCSGRDVCSSNRDNRQKRLSGSGNGHRHVLLQQLSHEWEEPTDQPRSLRLPPSTVQHSPARIAPCVSNGVCSRPLDGFSLLSMSRLHLACRKCCQSIIGHALSHQ